MGPRNDMVGVALAQHRYFHKQKFTVPVCRFQYRKHYPRNPSELQNSKNKSAVQTLRLHRTLAVYEITISALQPGSAPAERSVLQSC